MYKVELFYVLLSFLFIFFYFFFFFFFSSRRRHTRCGRDWSSDVCSSDLFHDVLITLGFFSIFQFEVNLTVIAALLTLVGFSVNDTIVVFDRIRENLRMHRRSTLYDVTNDSINQTLSRTIITSGLVFLSVLALVLFGGEVLRRFSVALLIGIVFGTYSSVAIASPIMVWWQQRLEAGRAQATTAGTRGGGGARRQPVQGTRNAKASAAAR